MQIEIITIKYGISQLTLKLCFDELESYGTITSFLNENCTQRAFFDRYDMKEINSLSEFKRLVKYYNCKKC
jgi:hypothetical protein